MILFDLSARKGLLYNSFQVRFRCRSTSEFLRESTRWHSGSFFYFNLFFSFECWCDFPESVRRKSHCFAKLFEASEDNIFLSPLRRRVVVPTEAEDLGSISRVERNFYFRLNINFLLQFLFLTLDIALSYIFVFLGQFDKSTNLYFFPLLSL